MIAYYPILAIAADNYHLASPARGHQMRGARVRICIICSVYAYSVLLGPRCNYRMSSNLAVNSISELPPALTIQRSDKKYVTLPVVILALQQLKLGQLLITDFTENNELGFACGQLPQLLPDKFFFNGKQLSLSKVLVLGLTGDRTTTLWKSLKSAVPQVANYDYSSQHLNILHLGIVAVVNFKVNNYRDCLEGFLGSFSIYTRESMRNGSKIDLPPERFQAFMSRYAENMDVKLYDSLIRHFPIESYVSRESLLTREAAKIRSDLPSQPNRRPAIPQAMERLQNSKIRKLNPRDAVFQQQQTQVQNIQDGTVHKESVVSPAPITEQNWAFSTINVVDFSTLHQISLSKIKDGTLFQTSGKVTKIIPGPDAVFVRPFGRTLKAAPLKVYVEENSKLVALEIVTEQDACHFFGLSEIEVAIDHIPDLTAKLAGILGKKVTVVAEKRTFEYPSTYKRAYWNVHSTLSSLSG